MQLPQDESYWGFGRAGVPSVMTTAAGPWGATGRSPDVKQVFRPYSEGFLRPRYPRAIHLLSALGALYCRGYDTS